ncbi:MAG: hypothetical protein O6761_05840 [Thaumarchaeota archaeon]|nr:hypothetical protein [Nitrososphaerota archaeon]
MKYTTTNWLDTTMVLHIIIIVIVIGTLGLGGNSYTSLMVGVPQSQEQFGMLGHVEYTVMDSSGNIIQYAQGDNIITNDGKSCVGQKMFGTNGQGSCFNHSITNNEFIYIGIGNGTSTSVSILDKTLADADGNDQRGTCATTGVGGEMARRQVEAEHTADPTESYGAIVTLDTYDYPFTFVASNATTIIDSGIFNNYYLYEPAEPNNTRCPVGSYQLADDNWSMLARQLFNGADGVAVNNGDSLTVKWIITIE